MENTFYNQIITILSKSQIQSPRLEARLLLAHVCGQDSNEFNPYSQLSQEQQQQVLNLLSRRIQHEPLDKILGYRDFYKYRFLVNNNVLSPRSDSEILVETAIELVKQNNFQKVLELGVGSGCLLLSILADISTLQGVGADISLEALSVAKKNAVNLSVETRTELLKFDYFKDKFAEEFDLIISNPPYIPTKDIENLAIEVRDYDPKSALDGGNDGLSHYRQIAMVSKLWLKTNGYIILEVGIDQADAVISIFTLRGWKFVETRCDLSQIKRCVIMQK